MTLIERLDVVMTAMKWDHADLVRVSGQSSSVVSQWLGKGSKLIKTIGKMEAADKIATKSGFSALWIAKGLGPMKPAAGAKVQQLAWPFDSIDAAKVQALPQRHRDKLQGAILHAAGQLGLDVVANEHQLSPGLQAATLIEGGQSDLDQTGAQNADSLLLSYNKMDPGQQLLFRQLLKANTRSSEWVDTTNPSTRTRVSLPQGKEGEQPAKQSPTSNPKSKRGQS